MIYVSFRNFVDQTQNQACACSSLILKCHLICSYKFTLNMCSIREFYFFHVIFKKNYTVFVRINVVSLAWQTINRGIPYSA